MQIESGSEVMEPERPSSALGVGSKGPVSTPPEMISVSEGKVKMMYHNVW